MRIINDYRSNRITVEYVPKEKEYESLAETCNGLFRATEVDSSAEEAYDNAFEEAVTGGFGALRLRNEYEDEYSGESTPEVRIYHDKYNTTFAQTINSQMNNCAAKVNDSSWRIVKRKSAGDVSAPRLPKASKT